METAVAGNDVTAAALGLRRGEWVRLRQLDEIAATLDENGATQNLPFMPEMLSLRGKSFQVAARVTKTCDTINFGPQRAMPDAVHLVGARCDGSSHGGCQAACLLYLKEAWLKRHDPRTNRPEVSVDDGVDDAAEAGLVQQLQAAAQPGPETYRCQATEILAASKPIKGLAHYVDDLRTRNAPLPKLVKGSAWTLLNKYQRLSRRFPRRLRYRNGEKLPLLAGKLTKTPIEKLNLQPGELVEVKSRAEIEATLGHNERNRGLLFGREMLPYCGRRMRVQRRVDTIVDEKTGKLTRIKGDCIILEGSVCNGIYSALCPREIPAYWREIWLRRVVDDAQSRTGR